MVKPGRLVYCKYRDHVQFRMSDPEIMSPGLRECLGWLVAQQQDYVVVSWDRDTGPAGLKAGDPKATGIVILRGDLVELRGIG